MSAPYRPGMDWAVIGNPITVDGDTVRLHRRRVLIDLEEPGADGLIFRQYMWIGDDRDVNPRGVPIRLITLNTPERGRSGYTEARADLAAWIDMHLPIGLRVETWPGGGFDRVLGDLYVAGDRAATASQWMLRRGWEPYHGVRP